MARERDDLRALNEQVLRNQAALRQQVASLQALQASEAAHVKDLEEQVPQLASMLIPLAHQRSTGLHTRGQLACMLIWAGVQGQRSLPAVWPLSGAPER